MSRGLEDKISEVAKLVSTMLSDRDFGPNVNVDRIAPIINRIVEVAVEEACARMKSENDSGN
jgi:hypothetical protein